MQRIDLFWSVIILLQNWKYQNIQNSLPFLVKSTNVSLTSSNIVPQGSLTTLCINHGFNLFCCTFGHFVLAVQFPRMGTFIQLPFSEASGMPSVQMHTLIKTWCTNLFACLPVSIWWLPASNKNSPFKVAVTIHDLHLFLSLHLLVICYLNFAKNIRS